MDECRVGRLRRSAADRICQARGMIARSEKVTVTQALVGRKPRAPRILLGAIDQSHGFETSVVGLAYCVPERER
jgi:hypothetical protein